jgi:hypothetical protein
MKKSLLEVSVVVTTSPAVSDTPTLVKGAFDPGSVVPMVLQPSAFAARAPQSSKTVATATAKNIERRVEVRARVKAGEDGST